MASDLPNQPHKKTVRQLAAEAAVPVREALQRLVTAGFAVGHAQDRLEGSTLRRARETLGQRAWGPKSEGAEHLDAETLALRMLRPLREKGKTGRNHHTHETNVWGKGIPDHQKGEAQAMVARWLAEGVLDHKASNGQRHVWLTLQGLALLATLERQGDGGEP